MSWHPGPMIAWTNDGSGYVVATSPDTLIYHLHDSAAVIWEALTQSDSGSDVVARVSAATGLTAEDVGPDVRTYLQRLLDLGIVVHDPGRPDD